MSKPNGKIDLSPSLREIVDAAARDAPKGHAEALTALLRIARSKVPARGILDPGVRDEPDLYLLIEVVAKQHLGLKRARRDMRKALQAADLDVNRRDDIEAAALDVQAVSDTAYFYTGLAFGLVFAGLNR